jgi:hypothetical protein
MTQTCIPPFKRVRVHAHAPGHVRVHAHAPGHVRVHAHAPGHVRGSSIGSLLPGVGLF